MSSPSPGPAGLAVSLGLHVLALAGVALFVRPAALPEAVERVITVELVAAPPPSAAAPAPDPAAPALSEAGALAAPPAADGMIEATQMLAGAALADPRNAEARQMLDLVETALRREQVCGIEAMEQIKRDAPERMPECVISYAFADTRLEGDTVIAEGAALHAGALWYRLAYECTLGADLASVTAFRYRVGERIPDEERERLGLAPCL